MPVPVGAGKQCSPILNLHCSSIENKNIKPTRRAKLPWGRRYRAEFGKPAGMRDAHLAQSRAGGLKLRFAHRPRLRKAFGLPAGLGRLLRSIGKLGKMEPVVREGGASKVFLIRRRRFPFLGAVAPAAHCLSPPAGVSHLKKTLCSLWQKSCGRQPLTS